MRLRRSVVGGPGVRRVRRGRGFSYHDADGSVLRDPQLLDRIAALAIPPAWRNVWICPQPNGHIQAVGTDAAGRRQYLYHARWHQERNGEKFDRVLRMAPALPAARAVIAEDLAGLADGAAPHRDRVLALALYLLDRGYFRAGSESYANKDDEENNSYGVATLQCGHVAVGGDAVVFDYTAKHGIRRTWQIDDPVVVAAVGRLVTGRRPDERLLVCECDDPTRGGRAELRAEDLNARFKELVGQEHSVKDIRTWHGTVLAAAAFCDADPPVNKTVRTRVEAAVMREVSTELGNTPAVARSSYVDPRVVRAYENGATIAAAARRAARAADRDTGQAIVEKATARLIRRVR